MEIFCSIAFCYIFFLLFWVKNSTEKSSIFGSLWTYNVIKIKSQNFVASICCWKSSWISLEAFGLMPPNYSHLCHTLSTLAISKNDKKKLLPPQSNQTRELCCFPYFLFYLKIKYDKKHRKLWYSTSFFLMFVFNLWF